VFFRHRLDFCCGGGQKLADACREAGLDAEAVLAEITAQGQTGADERGRWDTRPLPDLVDHILTQYHEPLHRDFQRLVEAAHKVERVHAGKAACPQGLASHLERIHTAIEDHMGKEELVLFPALRAGNHGHAVHMPIRVLMQEHDDHGEDLRRIRELTGDLQVPAEACGTWRALYEALLQLEADLMEHIHLENNVLFPRALSD
jgi:regulator of cell morphogenesis and NO signaling